jgi:hypothetical protein
VDKDIGLVFENIDPYITLRILAENSTNSDLNVYWGYADIVDNGWVTKDEILSNVGAGQEILIVTEGSSDTHILRKAFSLLYSDISDFFTFVDMEEITHLLVMEICSIFAKDFQVFVSRIMF